VPAQQVSQYAAIDHREAGHLFASPEALGPYWQLPVVALLGARQYQAGASPSRRVDTLNRANAILVMSYAVSQLLPDTRHARLLRLCSLVRRDVLAVWSRVQQSHARDSAVHQYGAQWRATRQQ